MIIELYIDRAEFARLVDQHLYYLNDTNLKPEEPPTEPAPEPTPDEEDE